MAYLVKWYHFCFDTNWVRCNNWKCRKEFVFKNVSRKRKCPKCGGSIYYDNTPQEMKVKTKIKGGTNV